MSRAQRIRTLAAQLDGLSNNARYWDLRRTYGDYSDALLVDGPIVEVAL